MPWLASQQILIDLHEWMAIDKHMGYDILNPPPLGMWACVALHRTLPPILKKILVPKPPALVGYLLPGPIMATVQGCIEGITFQEVLKAEDAKIKLKYADHFLTWAPDTTDHAPGHIFYGIHLKDPTKVNNGKGYVAPKKYQESWKKLLDEHLQLGRIQPSASEYASPAFCIPKYIASIPNLAIPPCWVNDYRALNSNTI